MEATAKKMNLDTFMESAKSKGIRVDYDKDRLVFSISYTVNLMNINLNVVKKQIDSVVPRVLNKSELPTESKQDIEVNIRWKPALGDVVLFTLSTAPVRLYDTGDLYSNEDFVTAFDGITKMKKSVDAILLLKGPKS